MCLVNVLKLEGNHFTAWSLSCITDFAKHILIQDLY